jgi:hypothetical protein
MIISLLSKSSKRQQDVNGKIRLVEWKYQSVTQIKLLNHEATNLDIGFTNYCATTKQEFFYMSHKTNKGINLPLKSREWKNHKHDSAVVQVIESSLNFNIEEII